MPRFVTRTNVFTAVAEPHRRAILDLLASRERPVTEVVEALRLAQPSVSKHLKVLREVGLVEVRRDGRRMLYRTNAHAIRPIHDWAGAFERYWTHQLQRIKERAESK
ncbi:MAG: ArsR/SmtB family transcription factor [Bacteroidota bacterium]